MLSNQKRTLAGWTSAAVLVAGIGIGTAVARETAPHHPDNLAMGEIHVKRLVPYMDQDAAGKVSRDAFMKYMGAEFDRLDKSKSGSLDVRELTQEQSRQPTFAIAGK